VSNATHAFQALRHRLADMLLYSKRAKTLEQNYGSIEAQLE
jgi:hypothetical protein